jgi:hypothetical protein
MSRDPAWRDRASPALDGDHLLCPGCGRSLLGAEEMEVEEEPLWRVLPVCPACGGRSPLSNDEAWLWLARRFGGRLACGPADAVAFQVGMDAEWFATCLERALELLPPDASDAAANAMLLWLWLGGERDGEPDFEKVFDQAQAEGTLAGESEYLGQWFDVAMFAAFKRPQGTLPETSLDFFRMALAGLRYAGPWARWYGRRSNSDAGPRGHPRGQRRPGGGAVVEITDAQRALIQRMLDLRRSDRAIARAAKTTRHQVRRFRAGIDP